MIQNYASLVLWLAVIGAIVLIGARLTGRAASKAAGAV